MKNKKRLELLAPAQNIDIAKAAIIYGADAVYIGAKSFGARKSACNNNEDIKELVHFAHKYNVKIYVTVNTILDDIELVEAEKLIKELYDIGVDAIIIQDMGLLETDLPPIEIHASTQCNIRTLEKVKFFENIGIKRAILARELSIDEIKEISNNSNIELECFIHGALCVSYSGQCYMSAYNGGRSANRGECAQACRKKYSLMTEKGKFLAKDKYLLSLKDFCAEKYLENLIEAGVKSFKIEGRLKDETYVKNVVLYYRRLLDKYEKASKGEIVSDFKPDINKVFNRGYTTYFLNQKDTIFNFDTPKSKGEFIGTVLKTGKNFFEIKTNSIISPQDGLCFILNGNLEGCLVNRVEGNKIYPNKFLKLKAGDKIYRNQDTKFEATVKNSKTKRLIKVKVTVFKNEISINDGEYETSLPFSFDEEAKDYEKMKESFQKCFKKSGENIFYADEIVFKTDVMPFLSVSSLNKLRNELYSKLEDIRLKNYKRNEFQKTTRTEYKEKITDYRLNIHNKKAENFYKKCGIEKIEPSLEKSKNYKNKELMRTKHCLRHALNICLKEGNKKETLFLVDETGRKYPLLFDCANCNMVIIAP